MLNPPLDLPMVSKACAVFLQRHAGECAAAIHHQVL